MKDWWHKELKRMHDEVDRLRKARTVYIQRHQEWERCRDAARIAEQGAEIGATGENKVINLVLVLLVVVWYSSGGVVNP